jgi:hypothetical protein
LPVVAGYEVQEDLGRGARGIGRYLARQLAVKRAVLLEVVFARDDPGQAAWGTLRSSAAAMGKLDHPNLLQVYEAGDRDRQLFYNAVELIEGPPLTEVLQARPLPVREALAVVEVLARAVHCAHERGVVHRSLKPASIRLQPVDEGGKGKTPAAPAAPPICRIHGVLYLPKITDWGLGRRPVEGEVTDAELQGEHPSYLAPEQAWGRVRDIGPATDVYALGAILHECLTGRLPFRGATPSETLDRISSGEPVPAAPLRGLPIDASAICRRCLAKHSNRRYSTALQLAADLRRCLDGRPILGRRITGAEYLGRLVRRSWRVVFLLLLGGIAGGLFAWSNVPARSGASGSMKPPSVAMPESVDRRALAWNRERVRELEGFRNILLAERAVGGNDPAAAKRFLSASPQDMRQWEWGYLALRAGGWKATVITGDGPCTAMSLSPQGTQVAASGAEPGNVPDLHSEAAAWDTVDRRKVASFNEGATKVRGLAYNPTGTRLALLREKRDGVFAIDLIDPATGVLAGSIPLPVTDIATMAFSPDGARLVLADARGLVHLVAVNTGQWLGTRPFFSGDPKPGEPSYVRAAPLTTDGDHVAAVAPDGMSVCIDRVQAGRSLNRKPMADVVLCLATHPDTSRVAVGLRDHTAVVWGVGTGSELLRGHRSAVTGIAFDAEGRRIATCSADGTVKIWDPRSGDEILTIPIAGGIPSAIAFGGGYRLAVAHGSKVSILEGGRIVRPPFNLPAQ